MKMNSKELYDRLTRTQLKLMAAIVIIVQELNADVDDLWVAVDYIKFVSKGMEEVQKKNMSFEDYIGGLK